MKSGLQDRIKQRDKKMVAGKKRQEKLITFVLILKLILSRCKVKPIQLHVVGCFLSISWLWFVRERHQQPQHNAE